MSGLHLVRGPQRLDPADFATGPHLAGLPLASFGRRAASWVLDFNLSSIAFVAIVFPLLALMSKAGMKVPTQHVTLNMFGNWYSVAWHATYFAVLTWLGRGQTPAKRLLGIRVRSLGHEPISLWQSIERALGYGASLLEGGFGFVQYFLNHQRQTVHDRIAETVVVREVPGHAPASRAQGAPSSVSAHDAGHGADPNVHA